MNTVDEIASRAATFLAQDIAPRQDEWRVNFGVSREMWMKAGALGLISPDAPVEYGGNGGDFRAMAAVLEARAYNDDRSWGVSNQAIVINYLLHHGTDAQKDRYLQGLIAGRLIGAIAMTEPHAGSDLKNISARAEPAQGGGYSLSGRKTFISNVRNADLIVVAAKVGDGVGVKSISLFLVDATVEGYSVVQHLPKIGQQGIDTSEIDFAGVALGDDALLGGVEGRGFAQLMGELPYERLIAAVTAIATMERALALATEYAKSRSSFDQKLIDLQHIRFRLADLKVQCTIGRVFVDQCIERLNRGELDTATASIAKYWLTEAEFRTADECLQIFGGNGYLSNYPISQIFIDCRVDRIYGGTSEIMREIIARTL